MDVLKCFTLPYAIVMFSLPGSHPVVKKQIWACKFDNLPDKGNFLSNMLHFILKISLISGYNVDSSE